MTANGWFQIGLFVAAIFLVTKPLGVFMVRVFEREKTCLDFVAATDREVDLPDSRR